MSQTTLKTRKDTKTRTAWGSCRVSMLAHFITIQEKLDAGWPLTTIHEQLKDSLPGVSYTQFVYHIRKRIPSTSKRRISSANTGITTNFQPAQNIDRAKIYGPEFAIK